MAKGAALPGSPVKSERRRRALFTSETAPRQGKPKGVKDKLTRRKVEIIANTGMMPVDFFAMVMRDQLYNDYTMTEIGSVKSFSPAPGAKKLLVTLQQRLQAANSLAPYVHKRMPIAIEGGDKPLTFIDAGKLAQLSVAELEAFVALMERLGVATAFEGHNVPRTGTL